MEMKDIILAIREKYSLSQDQLAEDLFVTRQAVSRWENGQTAPNKETLKRISQKYSINPSTLLGIDDSLICQSCGMDLQQLDDFGTNDDDTVHTEYCQYCFNKGAFTSSRTIDEMIESNLRFLDEYNKEKGLSFTKEQARIELKEHLSTLKRWKKQ